MLLIGDVHINSRYKEDIVKSIYDYINNYENEKNVVFVGDFVYHFNYDRKALLQLFDLFVDFYKKGKNIYVLAGNHDRINEEFVFEEAKKSFDIVNEYTNNGLYFITQPLFENIEGRNILFLPYNYNISYNDTGFENQYIDKYIKELLNSKNPQEYISGKVNKVILDYTKEYQDLLILHHYYFEGVTFPGQKTKFNFKDVAISSNFLDYENIYFLSGHLHQAFSYKNFFCTGSIWYNSFLENNQIKFFFDFDPVNFDITAYPIAINPYLSINFEQEDGKIDENYIINFINNLYDDFESYMNQGVYKVTISSKSIPDIKNINLTINSDSITYENIDQYIDKGLLDKLKDFKIRKYTFNSDKIQQLFTDDKNLQTSLSDRKELLKEHLKNKYLDEYEKYEDKLKELKII